MDTKNTQDFLENVEKLVCALGRLGDEFDKIGKNLLTSFSSPLTEGKEDMEKEKRAQRKAKKMQENMSRWPLVLSILDTEGRKTELVQPPESASAVKYPPGDVYQAGFNEFYVKGGKSAKMENGRFPDGYLITRMYAAPKNEMRWHCSCPHFARAQFSNVPYCKHIFAVSAFLDNCALHSPALNWMRFLVPFDAMHEISMYAHDNGDDFFLEQAQEAFPDLKDILNDVK